MCRILSCVLIVVSILLVSECCWAEGGGRNPFVDRSFHIESLDPVARTATLTFSAELVAEGTATLQLDLPYENDPDVLTQLISGNRVDSQSLMRGNRIQRSWVITIPQNGYIQIAGVWMNFNGTNIHEVAKYRNIDSYSLYAEFVDGRIVSQSNRPDGRFTNFPLTVPVDDFPIYGEKRDPRAVASTTNLTITIEGRIETIGWQGVVKGVPAVPVFFDWDSDNSAATYQHPVYDNGAVDYVFTDEDGNFSFQRQVSNVDDGSWIWSIQNLRMIIKASNEAAYYSPWGSEYVFPQNLTIPVAISPSSPVINLTGRDRSVDNVIGNALRYLWRARQFCVTELWRTPTRIAFDYDDNPNPGDGARFKSPDFPWEHAYILFVSVPDAITGYHEYGHYIQYLYADRAPMGQCGGADHWWALVSNDECAFTEGWAEAYAAATLAHWYEVERPALREDEPNSGIYSTGEPYAVFQWPDFGHSFITSNNANVEGTVAAFIYNLWDDVRLRAPNYEGDNEDLGVDRPFGYPRPWLLYAGENVEPTEFDFSCLCWRRPVPALRVYKGNYLGWVNTWYPITFPYHKESINSMYDRLTNVDSDHEMRPATPTALTVTGNKNSRTLTWNDNTEPVTYTYNTETSGHGWGTVDLFENNEYGFYVFRKKVTDAEMPWQWDGRDGRLDKSYQMIRGCNNSVPTYTHSIVDNELLEKGLYSYVVVAYTYDIGQRCWDGLAIPKAEATIEITGNIAIERDQWDKCTPVNFISAGQVGKYIVRKKGGQSPTYQWIFENLPSYIGVQGAFSDTLKLTNNYATGASISTAPFGIRCIVTDGSQVDTSMTVYPAIAPMDAMNRFVSVGKPAGLTKDTQSQQALDFLGRPGLDVTSVRILNAKPVPDSNGYTVSLKGFSLGSMAYDNVRLLAYDHPPGSIVTGSASCGFSIVPLPGYTLDDSMKLRGFIELPLKTVVHSRFGSVLNAVRERDTLSTTVASSDSLVLVFSDPDMGATVQVADSLVRIDSSRQDWIREYLLEISGNYSHIPITTGPVVMPVAEFPIVADRHERMKLWQNVPNPVNSVTTLSYSLAKGGVTTLVVTDMVGRTIRTVVNEVQSKGEYSITVSVEDLPSGIYFYRLTCGDEAQVRMMTILH